MRVLRLKYSPLPLKLSELTSLGKLLYVQVDAGFTPSKDTLKKVRRRCSRESDFDSDEKIQSLAQKFKYRMGNEFRREMLYNLQYSTEY